MNITRFEAIPVSIKMDHALHMAVATVQQRDSVIVRLFTDSGLVGLGEVVIAPYFCGETQKGAVSVIEKILGPSLVGKDVFHLNLILQSMDELLEGNPAAKSGLDMAIHDLQAQALGVPLYQLLGGKVRDEVKSTWAISATQPQEAVDEALKGIGLGFGAVKIKVGTANIGQDVESIRAVRQAVGDQVQLRADANQAWKPEMAIWFLNQVEDCHLQFIEQPVKRDDLDGMAQVAKAVTTPVAPDEGLFTARDAMNYIRKSAAGGVVMKVMKAGGIEGCRRLAAVVQAANLCLHLGGMPGQTSISAAAETHLAVCLPDLNWDAGIYAHATVNDPVSERLLPVKGAYRPPEGTGLGVTLDEKALAACRLDR